MRYRAIALDLDGTLLDRSGQIGPRTLAAVAAAVQAGVLVIPCTGRAWREARGAMAELIPLLTPGSPESRAQAQPPRSTAAEPLMSPGVFVGGAMVCDLNTGQALDLAVFEAALARQVIEHLFDLPESVLVFRDANVTGHDYLITGTGTLGANTQWWFEATGATVCFARTVGPAECQHVLRVGMVGRPDRVAVVAKGVEQVFGARVKLQHFQAVQRPDPAESVSVLEVFAPSVDKWRGLSWIASARGLDAGDLAAIGDEVNDVAMLKAAGCGIAMGNAIAAVKAAARHVTADCDAEGAAVAIENLLSGKWE